MRRHLQADRAAFLALIDDPAVMQHLSRNAVTEEREARASLWDAARMGPGTGSAQLFAICETLSDRYVGIAHVDPATGPHEAEIGLALLPSVWGQGLGAETASALISRLWMRGAKVVVAHVAHANERAVGLVRKLGMQRDAAVDTDFDRYAVTARR